MNDLTLNAFALRERFGLGEPMDDRPTAEVKARMLHPGDLFRWCGRWIEVNRIRPAHGATKVSGVHVFCTINGSERRLHYWADEIVVVDISDQPRPMREMPYSR